MHTEDPEGWRGWRGDRVKTGMREGRNSQIGKEIFFDIVRFCHVGCCKRSLHAPLTESRSGVVARCRPDEKNKITGLGRGLSSLASDVRTTGSNVSPDAGWKVTKNDAKQRFCFGEVEEKKRRK